MAEITVTNRNEASWGNQTAVNAQSSSVADTNTWDTGLGKIDNLILSQGTTKVWSWTAVGGIITFTVASGPMTGVGLIAIGTP